MQKTAVVATLAATAFGASTLGPAPAVIATFKSEGTCGREDPVGLTNAVGTQTVIYNDLETLQEEATHWDNKPNFKVFSNAEFNYVCDASVTCVAKNKDQAGQIDRFETTCVAAIKKEYNHQGRDILNVPVFLKYTGNNEFKEVKSCDPEEDAEDLEYTEDSEKPSALVLSGNLVTAKAIVDQYVANKLDTVGKRTHTNMVASPAASEIKLYRKAELDAYYTNVKQNAEYIIAQNAWMADKNELSYPVVDGKKKENNILVNNNVARVLPEGLDKEDSVFNVVYTLLTQPEIRDTRALVAETCPADAVVANCGPVNLNDKNIGTISASPALTEKVVYADFESKCNPSKIIIDAAPVTASTTLVNGYTNYANNFVLNVSTVWGITLEKKVALTNDGASCFHTSSKDSCNLDGEDQDTTSKVYNDIMKIDDVCYMLHRHNETFCDEYFTDSAATVGAAAAVVAAALALRM